MIIFWYFQECPYWYQYFQYFNINIFKNDLININISNTPKMPPDSDHSLGWFESWFSDWARFCRDSLCAADKGCSAQVFIFLDDHLYKVEQLELANVLCLYLICLPLLSSPPLTLWIEQFDKRRRKKFQHSFENWKILQQNKFFPCEFLNVCGFINKWPHVAVKVCLGSYSWISAKVKFCENLNVTFLRFHHKTL